MTITLYTAATPNGYKISVALELLKLSYKVVKLDIMKGETHTPEFLKVNPNGKIPAITDSEGPKNADGSDFSIFESGAILLYLTDKYDKARKLSYSPTETPSLYYEQLEWLFFQNAGLGPIQGQLGHFKMFAPEKIEYGINRYSKEARTYYNVLNKRLADNGTGYVVGDHLSIVDASLVGWVSTSIRLGIDLKEEFPNVFEWITRLAKNDAVYKGFQVPSLSPVIDDYRS